jgi:hypothetical protein
VTLAAFVERLYERGHEPEDFRSDLLKPGIVIVSPIRPPQSINGAVLPEATRNRIGEGCLAFRVEAVAALNPDAARSIEVHRGDIVKCRQWALDSVDESSGALLEVENKHILGVLMRANEE